MARDGAQGALRGFALVAATCLSLWASTALADRQTPPEQKAAFEAGLAQFRQANYPGAIATWESLLTTMGEETGYKVLYNLALAYEAIDDITKAIESYRAFEARVALLGDAGPDVLAHAEDARARRYRLEESNGAIEVRAPRRGGLVLTRVGSSAPRAAGYVLWVAPGRHTVDLYVGTENAQTIVVEVERGKTSVVDATPPESDARLQTANRAEPAPPEPLQRLAVPQRPAEKQPAPWSPQKWLVVGAALEPVAMALPISLYFVARGKRSDAAALGTSNPSYPGARATYNAWYTAYEVSYALPIAIAAVATALGLWPRPSAQAAGGVLVPSLSTGSFVMSF
jgi:tetratricopeptide (TPR) repeat protein